jgi:fructan beta-fructosidase
MKKIFICGSIAMLLFAACSKKPVVTPVVVTKPGQDSTVAAVSYRPLFHYTPTTNWINDPNGLLFFNGTYHLFSQYNPSGFVWGNMNWDQAIGSDLLSWQEPGIAIKELFNSDNSYSMIFSGSAVADSLNTSGFATQVGQVPLVAVYTLNNSAANGNAISQTQGISYSLDNGQTWTVYNKNPVLDINSTQFRDPKVFWYPQTKSWVMAVSKPDQDKVQFYGSADLKKWTFLSDFGAIGNTNQVWECPDIFPLTVEGTATQMWVLTVSGGGNENGFGGMQYFIGSFDGKKFTADNDNYPLYVDFGKDYYAGVTFNGMPTTDGRRVMIAWANNWSYAGSIPTSGYRGQYAIPRSLSLRKVNNSDGYHLLQSPVSEISQHETTTYTSASKSVNATTLALDSLSGTSLDIQFSLSMGSATTAGIHVLKGGNEQTVISVNKALSTISLDRTNSGQSSFSGQFSSIETAKMNNVDMTNITCRILIDNSIVEVFINQGEYAVTDLVFPTQAKGGIELFSQGGMATFSNINIRTVNKTIH